MPLPTRPLPLLLVCASPALLGGCLAKTAFDVVTAPVRVVGKTVDLMTTSQSEKDEKRGRALRQREERLGELDREYRKQSNRCRRGDDGACRKAERAYGEMRRLAPSVPYEPK